ncbi:FtsX-like permease family protein [Streptomyces sp. CAU 1734]|uniref:FtsX-like permease family protein n=1 Tax=Streptomyces sp. CAU 1734 TaxID=3140360 RepID=UPI003260BB00
MTLLSENRDRRDGLRGPPAAPAPSGRWPRSWGRDLALGIRFGIRGGREGWIRTSLAGLGVGLGVTLLLLAASVPQIIERQDARLADRTPAGLGLGERVPPTASSVVVADTGTVYQNLRVTGTLIRADGPDPVLPPGVDRLPGPGEMVVSPGLAELLAGPGGERLAARLDARVTGTVGDAGLLDPGEYLYYKGSGSLKVGQNTYRTDGFGAETVGIGEIDPVLHVLGWLICVVLLVPVSVFIATAVRFGGERRDRRLAALRLIGAGIGSTRRIAAGEALCGTVLGLLIGGVLFAAARLFAGSVRIWDLSAFPSDVVPVPGLAVLTAVAVPVLSVLVTVFSMRALTIEPLGVSRNARPRRRRLWWRLLLPVAGVVLLLGTDMVSDTGDAVPAGPIRLTAGAVLILLGVSALLPWLVQAVVNRLRGGPVSWQLAIRGIQLRSDAAARAVSGIMVAVAGVIALQMVFAGMLADFREAQKRSPAWGKIQVSAPAPESSLVERMEREFGRTPGVRDVVVTIESSAQRPPSAVPDDRPRMTHLGIAGCPALRKLLRLASCADGDVFVAHTGEKWEDEWVDEIARKGEEIMIDSFGPRPWRWTLPADTETVRTIGRSTPWGQAGVFATPGAISPERVSDGNTTATIHVDGDDPLIHDRVRDAAARIGPALSSWSMESSERDRQYASMQTGLRAGMTGTLALIAASMLISQTEQLRDRRRLLSALMAFGTRRSTLAWSLLWQSAVPVVLGTVVAVAGGLTLGSVILRLLEKKVADWWLFLPVAGTTAAMILLVTALSLPPLRRMTQPDGLRSE